mmetsp:Transcript_78149/g.207403  ORF Transcript_78149/g.207403 Transcript_78149/m.207403 type:complete len:91 (+) Transcript_78149:273-545(+)
MPRVLKPKRGEPGPSDPVKRMLNECSTLTRRSVAASSRNSQADTQLARAVEPSGEARERAGHAQSALVRQADRTPKHVWLQLAPSSAQGR